MSITNCSAHHPKLMLKAILCLAHLSHRAFNFVLSLTLTEEPWHHKQCSCYYSNNKYCLTFRAFIVR